MDRFRWCSSVPQFNEQMDESFVIRQNGVRLYNGPGRTAFDDGFLTLTTHRLIWARTPAGNGAIHLPLAAITSTELQSSSSLTGSSCSKIVVKLLSANALDTAFKSLPSPPDWTADWILDRSDKMVAMSSGLDFIRLGFTKLGHKEFHISLQETLNSKCWLVSNVPTTVSGRIRGTGGILAIERQIAGKISSNDRSISEAFEDLSRLISRAGEMVNLSRALAQKIEKTQETGGDVSERETEELRMAMLSMGLSDASYSSGIAQTSTAASSFHGKLAAQMCTLLTPILTAKSTSLSNRDDHVVSSTYMHTGGCMDLASVYCRLNRARGVDLVSPDDVLQAAKLLAKLDLPLRLKCFPSGVLVIQLASESDEKTLQTTLDLVKARTCLSAGDLSRLLAIAPLLASQRLLQAEEEGVLCRDDTEGGINFFPNYFLTGKG